MIQGMNDIIRVNVESCVGCNRCVRECPMELANITYQDEAGNIKVKIDSTKCVSCGRCVSACKHEARLFADDTEQFFCDLAAGIPISLIAAPSIRTNFTQYGRLFTYLKKTGVRKIYDVSLGADICTWAHIRFIEKTGATHLITQPCPPIVSYCKIYRHDLLKRLSPIHSPTACIAIYMKEYEGITDKIAALTPCIAKKDEFNDTGLSQYNVTFSSLNQYLNDHKIELPEEETGFDHYESGPGSLFPMPGGLKENIEFHFKGRKHISRAEGFSVYDKLYEYTSTPDEFLPGIFDVLNCIEGCNTGSAISEKKNYFMIDSIMEEKRTAVQGKHKREYFESLYETYDNRFDPALFMRSYSPVETLYPQVTDEEINNAFARLGKNDYKKQNINCEACGSDTCRDMARKIALGVNIPINCIVNAMETAKEEHKKNMNTLAQFEIIWNNVESGMVIIDSETRKVIDANPAAAFMFGSEREKMLGVNCYRLFGQHICPIIDEQKTVAKVERTFINSVGETVPVIKSISQIDYRGQPALLECFTDITYLKEAEKQKRLLERDSLLNAVISNYSGVIWSVDKDGVINLFNGLYLKEIGVTPSYIEGKTLELARQKNRHLDILKHVEKTYKEGPQDWISDIDGKKFHARTTPVLDEKGLISDVVGTIDDLTEMIDLQEKLKSALEEANMASQIAEEASQAKSNFLASMSHEIRTPMNAIIGMTQIAAKTDEIDKLKYCLMNIGNSSTHLLGLINDILDMSKIEAGKLELDHAPLNIEKMLVNVCNLFIEKTEQKNIKFNIILGTGMRLHYIGDELRLSQVITNILSNAVKFTPEKGKIELTAKEVLKENDYSILRFSVKDTGIGITPDQIERLFSAFEQAESSTTRRFGGTGLGLAISKSIVEKMDGSIWAKSEPGVGSEFFFEVRLKRPEQQRSAILYGNIRPADVKLLVVDADTEARDYFSSIVHSFGITNIDEADTIEAAVELALKAKNLYKPYDIVFVDYKFADDNGIDIFSKSGIHLDKNNVVMMTSFMSWNKVENSVNNIGVNRFVPKPLFPSAILNVINEIIGGAAKNLDIKSENIMEGAPDLSGITLLLAEDVAINREVFFALLEETKVSIDVAENGLIAVEKFRDNPYKYDVIIMDVQMPEMDGYNATRTIRSLNTKRAKTIPIIAMTANVFKEDVEKCLSSGMNDHLAKPIEVDEVLKKIAIYCRGRRAQGPGHAE